MAASSSSGITVPPGALAPSQSIVAGTTNLGGIEKKFLYAKISKNSEERVLNKDYKTTLRSQVEAMIAEGSNLFALTELNPTWYNWLDSEIKSNPRFQGWKLYHDGLGVAIMRGPGIQATDDPEQVLVYDDAMLSEDPADRSRLDWRTIFCGQFHLRDKPEHPAVYLLALHIFRRGRRGPKF